MSDRFVPRSAPRQSPDQPGRYLRQSRRKRRSPIMLLILLLLWSICLGWGLALASDLPNRTQLALAEPAIAQASSGEIGTVDIIPSQQQFGQELYLENCATCHIGIPPEVLPSQTWQQVIQDAQHYGTVIKPPVDPTRLLVWNYLRAFSRPLNQEEETPYRVGDSRYFRILHPKLKLSRKVSLSSCVTCHPGAAQYNFRKLKPEWQTDPTDATPTP